MRKGIGSGLCALIAVLTASCMDGRQAGGTGIGNPVKGSVTVAMQAASGGDGLAKSAAPRNPDGSFTIADAGGLKLTIRSAFANVGRIKLKLPDGIDCKDADETECANAEAVIPGPIVADLMTAVWVPDPGAFRLPVGTYRRIEVRLEGKSKDKPGPDSGLDGHSLIIKGSFEYAGKADRRLFIALDIDEEVRFASDSGLALERGGLNRFLILLDVEKWLSGVDIGRCLDEGKLALDTDGALAIGKDNSCGQLQSDLGAAIKASGSLARRKEG